MTVNRAVDCTQLPSPVCVPRFEPCDWLITFSERVFTVGVTCIAEGFRGLVTTLASEGTLTSEACFELTVVRPFTVSLVTPFARSDVDLGPSKSSVNPILPNDGPVLCVLADLFLINPTFMFKSLTPFVSG